MYNSEFRPYPLPMPIESKPRNEDWVSYFLPSLQLTTICPSQMLQPVWKDCQKLEDINRAACPGYPDIQTDLKDVTFVNFSVFSLGILV